jgi:hypothetical protein
MVEQQCQDYENRLLCTPQLAFGDGRPGNMDRSWGVCYSVQGSCDIFRSAMKSQLRVTTRQLSPAAKKQNKSKNADSRIIVGRWGCGGLPPRQWTRPQIEVRGWCGVGKQGVFCTALKWSVSKSTCIQSPKHFVTWSD